jgi:hypothetical protein
MAFVGHNFVLLVKLKGAKEQLLDNLRLAQKGW